MRAALTVLLHAVLASAPNVDAQGGRAAQAPAPAPLYIEAEFTPPQTYVGAEVKLRLRLLRAPHLPHGVLRPPHFGDDAEVTSIGRVRTYEETRLGATYEVREQNYLLVPRRAGRLVLPGPEVFGPLSKTKAFARVPRALEVRPPRTAPSEPWLPARRVTLEESWSHDPAALAAGQPVVRTLVVRAEGISGNRLPSLRMTGQASLSVHEDAGWFASEYLNDGMAGQRALRFILIAQDEGEIELPALSLAWWDTGADLPAVATLPARTLRIGEGVPAASAPLPEGMSPLDVVRWILAAVLLLGGARWWAYLRRQPEHEAAKRLRHACQRGAASAAHKALLEWWKGATGEATAPALIRMGAAWDESARAALTALDAAVYGRHAGWDGDAFWRAVRPWLRRRAVVQRAPAHPAGALPPLFKLQTRTPVV